MQEYAPRDPLQEYLDGRITLRKLRVMVEHLPPGNAWARHAHGPWDDRNRLLHDIDAQLRDLKALTYNIHRREGQPALQPEPLPRPKGRDEREAEARDQEQHAAERADLLRTLARTTT